MDRLDLYLLVIPKRRDGPFELTAHEQDGGPNAPSRTGLVGRAVKVPFAVSEEDFAERTESAVLFFVDLSYRTSTIV
jgi:hypothetical protein